jgi:citrate synthase
MADEKTSKGGAGLEGSVAGDSTICFIDGQKGILRYRGYDITELSMKSTFEEVVWLLWMGELPKRDELATFRASLAAETVVPRAVAESMRALPPDAHPMAALRTLVSVAGNTDADAECDPADRAANLRKATRLLGQTSAITAGWERHRKGKPIVAADPKRGFAENFLRMMHGAPQPETANRVFDECLVLHADHEFNASTFTARVIAATLADVHSAIVGAIGALKGPLHGGANTAVMNMLLEIDAQGGVAHASEWVRDALAQKKKISGFGHRVYKVDDPRATRLKTLAETLAKSADHDPKWFELSLAVAKAFGEQKNLPANVDFYSASTYYMLGIPPDLYTPIFAVSRTSGWIAHVMEQQANNRLIRPLSNYVGAGARAYAAIDRR